MRLLIKIQRMAPSVVYNNNIEVKPIQFKHPPSSPC